MFFLVFGLCGLAALIRIIIKKKTDDDQRGYKAYWQINTNQVYPRKGEGKTIEAQRHEQREATREN